MPHLAKSDACSQGLTILTGPPDVGGSCPYTTYQEDIHCCCKFSSMSTTGTPKTDCCWSKCTRETPPENCLEEVPNSQWVYHVRLGYYIAMQNWKGDSIVGIQNTFLPWGPCPENTKPAWDTCCCFEGCCWDECWVDNPPEECLPNIPGLQWAKNEAKGYFTVVKNSTTRLPDNF